MRTRRSLLAATAGAFGLSSGAWANSSATINLVPDKVGVNESGRSATITRVTADQTVYEQRGAALVRAGYQLFEIEMAEGARSDESIVILEFLNPHDMGQVLKNPHAHLKLGIWYADASIYEFEDGTEVTPDEPTLTRFDSNNASAILRPTVDEEYLYIVAQVVTPGSAPPGQQPSGEFRFNAEVK